MNLLLLMWFLLWYSRDTTLHLFCLANCFCFILLIVIIFFFFLLFIFSKCLAITFRLSPLLSSYFCSWVLLVFLVYYYVKLKMPANSCLSMFCWGFFLPSSYHCDYLCYFCLPFTGFIACTLHLCLKYTIFIWNAMCSPSDITPNLVYAQNVPEVCFPDNQTICNFPLFSFSCSTFLRLYGILWRKYV